jgi:hypothetical protein
MAIRPATGISRSGICRDIETTKRTIGCASHDEAAPLLMETSEQNERTANDLRRTT